MKTPILIAGLPGAGRLRDHRPAQQYRETGSVPRPRRARRRHAVLRQPQWLDRTGDSALAVWTRPSEAYLLELSGPCPDLSYAAIGLTSSMGRVSSRFDKVLVRDPTGGPRRASSTASASWT